MTIAQRFAWHRAMAAKAVAMERDRELPPIGVRLRAHCTVCKANDPAVCAHERYPQDVRAAELAGDDFDPCECECHDPTDPDAQEDEG